MRSSALQRAENSSMALIGGALAPDSAFQCSSASRKFLNYPTSARGYASKAFQCSSASRKFLNTKHWTPSVVSFARFSALQRAENSSIELFGDNRCGVGGFSALQRAENSSIKACARRLPNRTRVSVLFSEPKIPQCGQW